MTWQKALTQNLRTADDLLPHIPMTAPEKAQMEAILERFPLSITPYYLSLIDFSDPDDPIHKMCIPSLAETDLSGSFDTSGEAGNTVIEGMQHKYAQTVMILSTNQCAMYCRHCFRKRLVGLSDAEIARHFEAMRAYVRAHTEISNVLISGGDALLNDNPTLESLLALFADIEHLDTIRIATRVPVVFPERITGDAALLALLKKYTRQKQLHLVTQFNHPRELTTEAAASVRAVLDAGIPVKNQTVLLRGVNDDPAVLGALLRGLTRAGIAPYYIFQCRPVSGVKNQFQVPLQKGVEIVEKAKAMQNGLGKGLTYCLSHVTGKIEILGNPDDGHMLFRYHEARKPENLGRLFSLAVSNEDAWLDAEIGV